MFRAIIVASSWIFAGADTYKMYNTKTSYLGGQLLKHEKDFFRVKDDRNILVSNEKIDPENFGDLTKIVPWQAGDHAANTYVTNTGADGQNKLYKANRILGSSEQSFNTPADWTEIQQKNLIVATNTYKMYNTKTSYLGGQLLKHEKDFFRVKDDRNILVTNAENDPNRAAGLTKIAAHISSGTAGTDDYPMGTYVTNQNKLYKNTEGADIVRAAFNIADGWTEITEETAATTMWSMWLWLWSTTTIIGTTAFAGTLFTFWIIKNSI